MTASGLDPRTPIIVGAGQINDRELGSEPIDLMARCTEAALDDTRAAGAIRPLVEAVRVVWGIWPYRDPGRLVAERIGRPDAVTTKTTVGGNQVYDLVIDTAKLIARGDLDVAVVCGAESMRTRRADRRQGRKSPYLAEADGARPDITFGTDTPLNTELETTIGVHHAPRFYAMAETALRHRLGEGIDEHRHRIGALWSEASQVAAANPHAWLRTALTPDEISTASEANRPIAAPYPKLMTSNLDVDQGGAVILCSVEAAERAGIPRERWIFPWSGATAADHWYPTNRWAFDESPAMRLTGRGALDLAGVGVDDCALIDLYSCFPVAVQVAQREIGVGTDHTWTITGGLTFAAGPMNCYCILPLTRAVELLRATPDQRALLTGNGGWFTKHSALVLAGAPAAEGFRSASPQAEVDALPSRPAPASPAGAGTLETATVVYGRDLRPERAIFAVLDDDGSRHWAQSTDADTIDELLTTDACGRPVHLDGTTAHLP